MRKGLQQLLRAGKIANGHKIPTHIVMFCCEEWEAPQYILCFEEQVDMAYEYLKEQGVDYITVATLGRNLIEYRKEDSLKHP